MVDADGRYSVPDLSGEDYQRTLETLHRLIEPEIYLEIGTEHGETLGLSTCAVIAVDPEFRFNSSKLLESLNGRKFFHLHQTTSDEFFATQKIMGLGAGTPSFVLLDGLHHCEALLRDFNAVERLADARTVVAIHDVAPVEVGMVSRTQYPSPTPIVAHRLGWWTGDVWKFALLLKERRPDLNIVVLDSQPTGLMLVGNLDPSNLTLQDSYDKSIQQFEAMSLEEIGVVTLHRMLDLVATSHLNETADLSSFLVRYTGTAST